MISAVAMQDVVGTGEIRIARRMSTAHSTFRASPPLFFRPPHPKGCIGNSLGDGAPRGKRGGDAATNKLCQSRSITVIHGGRPS